MWSVCKKEIRQLFSSLTGYMAMAVFLILSGLMLFVFPETNVFDFGYASLGKFFDLAPWILLLLVPAITMRSFSDEFKSGTFEILQTKPLTKWQLVAGKYAGAVIVVLVALIPTLLYMISMTQLSGPEGGLDMGATIGSYLGLLLLAAVFTSLGILCSSMTHNPVVAFLLSALACFLIYSGCTAVSKLPIFESGADYFIEMAGLDFHYRNISRGVVDTRDLIYFVSVIFFFLYLTTRNLIKK